MTATFVERFSKEREALIDMFWEYTNKESPACSSVQFAWKNSSKSLTWKLTWKTFTIKTWKACPLNFQYKTWFSKKRPLNKHFKSFQIKLLFGAQCGNFVIFLPIRFYVKSNFWILKSTKSAVLGIFVLFQGWNVCSKLTKFRVLKMVKNASFTTSRSSKIDFT